MAVEVVGFVSTLMRYAREVGQAQLSGDESRIAAAEKRLKDYERACLSADRVVLDYPLSHQRDARRPT